MERVAVDRAAVRGATCRPPTPCPNHGPAGRFAPPTPTLAPLHFAPTPHPPSTPVNDLTMQAAAIARDTFGFNGEIHPLPGEHDHNYRVSGPGGDFVLKLSPAARRPVLDLIAACLDHLAAADLPAPVPRLVTPTAAAPRGPGPGRAATTAPPDPLAPVTFAGAPHLACAVTWLPGMPLAELRPRSPAVLEALGALLAHLDAALSGFDHPALDREFAWRMDTAPATIRAHLRHLDQGHDLVKATLDRATALLDPVLDALPHAVIHNDANDYNVIVQPSLQGARLAGLIDFGDVVRSRRAAEVAVAAAYAMLDRADPVEAACGVAGGYAAVAPLIGEECRAILPLVALRLCLSVTVQARQMREQPGNEYLAVSQDPAWGLLGQLARTDWRIAEFRIREACGLVPNPAFAAVTSRIREAEPRATVMPRAVLEHPRVLDLSVGSLDLPHLDAISVPGASQAWIERETTRADATVAVGRYAEPRLLYDTPAFRARGDLGTESRTLHLGLDLFAQAGTTVRSPLAGTVLAVTDNDQPLDYGPTVILRHTTPDGIGFHTLYGHLDRATLDHLVPGERVRAGDVIGWLGDAGVNGGWPPHLHLQVIAVDPLHDEGTAAEDRGNFSGVALADEVQVGFGRVGDAFWGFELQGVVPDIVTLGKLAARHPLVGDVRGRGLFLGLEIVRDRETREPFPEACAYIVDRAREMGVLLSVDGPGHNVLKVKPPMVFSEDDAALLVETLDAILAESVFATGC